jgi:hypothetical protein
MTVEVVRHVNNIVVISGDSFAAELTTDNNITRDIIALSLRQRLCRFREGSDLNK